MLHSSSAAEGLPHRRVTVTDVVRMVEVGLIQEDERLEILDGEIVEMSPKGYRHEGLKGAINRLWGRRCPPGFDFMQETGLYLSDFPTWPNGFDLDAIALYREMDEAGLLSSPLAA